MNKHRGGGGGGHEENLRLYESLIAAQLNQSKWNLKYSFLKVWFQDCREQEHWSLRGYGYNSKSFEIFGWQHTSFSIPKWSA